MLSRTKILALIHSLLTAATITILGGCQHFNSEQEVDVITLPFVKNSANECYFLDDFMPIPDSLVTGKSGALSLRYYTYNDALYKDWDVSDVVLSFYSRDDLCWSLFEEYFIENKL